MRFLIVIVFFLLGCSSSHTPPAVAVDENTLVPTGPVAFTFGPGDRMDIRVWRHSELDMEVTIAPDGGMTFPLVGRIQAAGLTYPDLVVHLEESLKRYYTDISVAVNVLEVNNQKVFVLGEVKTPAVLQIKSDLSIIEALTITGGINSDSRTSNVLLVRGGLAKPELFTVDVDAIYEKGDFTQLVYLQQGDIVVVPAKTIVNVERFFRRVQSMLAPVVAGSAIYRNAVSGGAQGTSSVMQ